MVEYSCPDHYRRLFELVTEKTKDPSTMSILELGCYHGNFVRWLQQQGYKAEGVDGNQERINQSSIPNLHHGELTALEDVFGQKRFDLIVAPGVFSTQAQLDYRYSWDGALVWAFSSPKEREELKKSLRGTINRILVSAYNQLAAGGFLIIHENTSEVESIDFSNETAQNIGYLVEKLKRQEAILQKPFKSDNV